MSTKKKTKEEMLDYICQTNLVKEAEAQKIAEEWYNDNVKEATPSLDDEELINQIEYGLYAIMADANMLMRMLDRLREEQREK